MAGADFIQVHNAQALERSKIPALDIAAFRQAVIRKVAQGSRIAALLGLPRADAAELLAVMADNNTGELAITSTVCRGEYPSLTPDCPQAHWFERELAEQCRIRPLGHPWLKPIRFQPALGDSAASGHNGSPMIGMTDFFAMDGQEVHEVAVGPVHAGIIEPGHFRFQCHGETVHHLEISLGYQHRGVERAMLGGPGPRAIHHIETAAGDATVGHAITYCRAMESLARCPLAPRAQAIRGVALELERIANHVGDLGAMAGDVGFLPTMSYCGRLRGDVLNMTAAICGNRFGRGLIRPGGAAYDLDGDLPGELLKRLEAMTRDVRGAVELLWNTPSVMGRFEGCGTISFDLGRRIGLVGVAARACGIDNDVRRDFPFGIFRFTQVPLSTWDTGDVFARAYVRWLEIQRSLAFIREQLESLPAGEIRRPCGKPAANHLAAALVEGWRGEICHVAVTGPDGRLERYKVVDPSFHNWFGLAVAMRGQQISDFPLCNKSFNLSYCGHDL